VSGSRVGFCTRFARHFGHGILSILMTSHRAETVLNGILVWQPLDGRLAAYAVVCVPDGCRINPMLHWMMAADFSVPALLCLMRLKIRMRFENQRGAGPERR
jgi:hypothetical protein